MQADELEECVHQFADLTLEALERFGADLMNQQAVLSWLAENVSDIYVVTAVLARASRSYCIGLRDAETEVSRGRGRGLCWGLQSRSRISV